MWSRFLNSNCISSQLVAPREAPPNLGEDFPITIKNTKFNITLEQANVILGRFGVVSTKAIHVESKEEPGIKTDDVLCVVKLRKHMPSFLPAYGVKLNIRYYGQPLQCSKCWNPGHLRKKCTNDNVEWSRYVRLLVDENVLNLEMIGSWAEKLQILSANDESVNSDL